MEERIREIIRDVNIDLYRFEKNISLKANKEESLQAIEELYSSIDRLMSFYEKVYKD